MANILGPGFLDTVIKSITTKELIMQGTIHCMHIEPLAASSYALGISNSFKKINVQELYSMVDVFCHLYPRNDDSLDLGGAERWRKVRTSQGVVVRRDAGDYGGNFSTYTPPTGEEALIIIAEDTNAGSPGRRIYVYSGGAWRYANLS